MSEQPAVVDNPHADVYRFWSLDFVIEVAAAIGRDDPASRAKTATTSAIAFADRIDNGNWPDFQSRQAFYRSVIGSTYFEPMRSLRTVSAQRRADQVNEQTLIDTLITFRALFDRVLDDDQLRAFAEIRTMSEEAYAIVMGAEGHPPTGQYGDTWPPLVPVDAELAKSVERHASDRFPDVPERMNRYKFMLTQRVGFHGANTINLAVRWPTTAGPDTSETNEVVDSALSWEHAIRELLPLSVVAAAWRRGFEFALLNEFERSLLPVSPAGAIQTEGSGVANFVSQIGGALGQFDGGFALMTNTVGTSVCCSTGDLNCHTDTSCVSVYSHCPSDGGVGCPGPGGAGTHHRPCPSHCVF